MSWNDIAATARDADSPINEALLKAYRDNDRLLRNVTFPFYLPGEPSYTLPTSTTWFATNMGLKAYLPDQIHTNEGDPKTYTGSKLRLEMKYSAGGGPADVSLAHTIYMQATPGLLHLYTDLATFVSVPNDDTWRTYVLTGPGWDLDEFSDIGPGAVIALEPYVRDVLGADGVLSIRGNPGGQGLLMF